MTDDIEREVRELADKLETDREIDRAQETLERRPARKGSRTGAWLGVAFIGIPAGLAGLLTVLSYSGVYVEPIRSWWTAPRADFAMACIAFGAFILSLALVRRGR